MYFFFPDKSPRSAITAKAVTKKLGVNAQRRLSKSDEINDAEYRKEAIKAVFLPPISFPALYIAKSDAIKNTFPKRSINWGFNFVR